MGWIGGDIEVFDKSADVRDYWNGIYGEIPTRTADCNSLKDFGTFSTRKEGEDALNRADICGCGVVKIIEGRMPAPSKTMIALKERIEREEQKLDRYFKEHNAKYRKSAYVGCKKCGSSINKEYVGSKNTCPVCGTSFFSVTDTITMDGYKANIKRWKTDYAAMEKKRSPQKGEYYLVKAHAYCG